MGRQLPRHRICHRCRNAPLTAVDLSLSVIDLFSFGLGGTLTFVHKSRGSEECLMFVAHQISLGRAGSGVTIVGIGGLGCALTLTLVLFCMRALILRKLLNIKSDLIELS